MVKNRDKSCVSRTYCPRMYIIHAHYVKPNLCLNAKWMDFMTHRRLRTCNQSNYYRPTKLLCFLWAYSGSKMVHGGRRPLTSYCNKKRAFLLLELLDAWTLVFDADVMNARFIRTILLKWNGYIWNILIMTITSFIPKLYH